LTAQVSHLTTERDSLYETSDSLNAEVALLKQMLSDATANAIQSGNKSEEYELMQEQFAKANREVTRLRQHLIEAEDVHTQEALKSQLSLDEYRAQINSLETDKVEFHDVSSDRDTEITRLEEKCLELQDMLEQRFSENERIVAESRQNETSLVNLQQVLQDFQTSQQSEIEFALAGMKRQLGVVNDDVDAWRDKADKAEARVVKMEKSVPEVEKLKVALDEARAVNRKLELDGNKQNNLNLATQAQAHLNEAMRRMRDGSEATIDRRLLANLLVPFISSPRGDRKRYEMLGVIASVLDFNEEEKYKVRRDC
jgi:chromosome segregation ATPase